MSTEWDGVRYEGMLDRTDPTKTSLTFSSPDQLSGFCVTYENGRFSVGYGEIRIALSENQFPETAWLVQICDALESVTQEGEQGSAWTLLFDEQTCLPISIQLTEPPIEISFSGWEIANSKTTEYGNM